MARQTQQTHHAKSSAEEAEYQTQWIILDHSSSSQVRSQVKLNAHSLLRKTAPCWNDQTAESEYITGDIFIPLFSLMKLSQLSVTVAL